MKIRLIKPMPQRSLGKVIPAGVVIDAPDGLWERLIRDGVGVPAHAGEPAPEGKGSTNGGGAEAAPRGPQKTAQKRSRKKVTA